MSDVAMVQQGSGNPEDLVTVQVTYKITRREYARLFQMLPVGIVAAVADDGAARETPRERPAALNATSSPSGVSLIRGVPIPNGTRLRKEYKGEMHYAHVQDGGILVNGECFTSPSAAARAITRSQVDGWTWWECCLPGKDTWQLLDVLRRHRRNAA